MNTKISARQFVKDGLVGVVVVLVSFAIIEIISFVMDPSARNLSSGLAVENFRMAVDPNFLAIWGLPPLFFGIITVFIGTGISSRFFESNTLTKQELTGAVMKTSGISCLVWAGIFIIVNVIFSPLTEFNRPGELGIIGTILFFSFLLGYTLAVVLGWLAVIIFKPQTRLSRMIICAMTSAAVAYEFGAMLIVLPFLMFIIGIIRSGTCFMC